MHFQQRPPLRAVTTKPIIETVFYFHTILLNKEYNLNIKTLGQYILADKALSWLNRYTIRPDKHDRVFLVPCEKWLFQCTILYMFTLKKSILPRYQKYTYVNVYLVTLTMNSSARSWREVQHSTTRRQTSHNLWSNFRSFLILNLKLHL